MASENAVRSNRITATKFLLINWSRFQNVTFEMSGSTLLTGVNGTGKSTVLDAMTYLLTGNTKFNLAAKDRDRGVKAYVRGDTHSTGSNRYLRAGEITSYIAMELHNPQEELDIVVGVSIESVSEADPATSKWFVLPGTRLADVHWYDVNEKTASIRVVPRTQLTVKGERPKAAAFMNRNTGVPQVLRALGIRTEVSRYQSKITKMMAFDPERNIDRFIQESVLEDDPVTSLQEIREYREQYAKVKEIYDNLLEGRIQLEQIEQYAQVYEAKYRRLRINELMLDYQALAGIRKEKEDISTRIRAIQTKLKALNKTTGAVKMHLSNAQERLTKAQSNNLLANVQGTIDELQHQRESLKRDLSDAEEREAVVLRFRSQMQETFSWGERSVQVSPEDKQLLAKLGELNGGAAQPAVDRQVSAVIRYTDAAKLQLKKLTAEQTHLNDHIAEELEHRDTLYEEKRHLESNRMVYDRDAEKAKAQIAKALEKKGIHTDVFLFAELVKDIADPKWRMAIETFLGSKRFYIIVDGRYVKDVMDIINEQNIYWAHAVMTDRLPKDLDEVRQGSAAEQLVITNVYARRYADYLLNGIHLCSTIEELHDHPKGGLMMNGMLAKSYAVTKMKMQGTRVCLGRDAIEIQKKENAKQIARSTEMMNELQSQLVPVEGHVRDLVGMNLDADTFDFGAAAAIAGYHKDIAAIEQQIEKIRDTPEFLAALQEQTDAQEAYNRALQDYTDHNNHVTACTTEIGNQEHLLDALTEKETGAEETYAAHVKEIPELEAPMLEDYRKATERTGGTEAIQMKSVQRQQQELNGTVIPTLRSEQQKYLKIIGRPDEFEIMTGAGQIPFYREEYRNVRNVKIDEARQNLEQKTQQLEDAFMNDFVAELKEKMDRATVEIDGINHELMETPFGPDTYRFEMKPRSDRSSFFNIAKRLDEYMDMPEMMMAVNQQNTQLDRDIQDFMNVILSDEDQDEYTDYRTYFIYDMRIISRQGQDRIEAELSQKQGSASGGEKQTPYFIILAASLLQCYPKDSCCERMAFIDEAFSALSRERIEQMVKYLEDNHFQVIYAAPPEKIDSIGSHIDTTVSLVTKGRYSFAIEGMAGAGE